MTTIPYDVSGRHVAVVGGGRSGLAASRLVRQQGGSVTLIDANTELAERDQLQALGASLGIVATLIKQELLLVIVGGVFVLEAASVILQVGSYKTRGKRIFRMAPLHHHFELSGWSEPKVITRFLIIAIVCALFSLTTLKLR